MRNQIFKFIEDDLGYNQGLNAAKSLKNHFFKLFRTEVERPPWPRMLSCCIAMTLPLVIGLIKGHLPISIYGSLAGYLLGLNDHLGPFKKRIQVLSLTFLLLITGFALGLALHDQPSLFYMCFTVLVYWVGVLGGDGAELERAALFLSVSLVIAFFSRPIPLILVMPLFAYATVAYVCALVAIPIIGRVKRHSPSAAASMRSSFKKSFKRTRENHIHAASYTAAALIAVALARYFNIERGYWIVITVLLVMRADRTQSLYVTSQRLVGTAAGVLFCDLMIMLNPDVRLMILWVAICGLAIPYALKKNYLYASFFITTFIISLLEMANSNHGLRSFETNTAFLRLRATFIGCLISVLGTLLSKSLSATLNKKNPRLRNESRQ